MIRLAYRSDLTPAQWQRLAPHIPAAKPGGRPRILSMWAVCNAIFYLLRNGCQWRELPRDFPKWQSVYCYFRAWCKDGTWQRLNDLLRGQLRQAAGRNDEPTAGSIDSQSVKTAGAADDKGFGRGEEDQGTQAHHSGRHDGTGVSRVCA